MTYECCEDMAANGVRILELRYAPSFLCDAHDGLKPDAMHAAILKGIERAERDFPIAVGLICLLQRIKTVEENRYWLDFAIEKKADFLAMDLADNELAVGPAPFVPLFEKAKSEGFAVTIHAGEAEGPQATRNIRDSIELLHADRIGLACASSRTAMCWISSGPGHGARVVPDVQLAQRGAQRANPTVPHHRRQASGPSSTPTIPAS